VRGITTGGESVKASVHGALVEVYGVGIALLGTSGVGKSECALELISRGHRIVADDVIELFTTDDRSLIGRAPERIRHHMEIRGLGIFNVPALFGKDSVLLEVEIELICRLQRWREGTAYERVGIEWPVGEIGGVPRPELTLPARPGGSMATIVEVVAREHAKRLAGFNAAAALDARLRAEMNRKDPT
jgi:HPr kinase/phosphorylase